MDRRPGLDLVEVDTDPGPDDFEEIRQFRPGSIVVPGAIPDLTLAIADILA